MGQKNIVKKLLEGNQRYITGGSLHPNQSSESSPLSSKKHHTSLLPYQ
jgi:hypothetical protein